MASPAWLRVMPQRTPAVATLRLRLGSCVEVSALRNCGKASGQCPVSASLAAEVGFNVVAGFPGVCAKHAQAANSGARYLNISYTVRQKREGSRDGSRLPGT